MLKQAHALVDTNPEGLTVFTMTRVNHAGVDRQLRQAFTDMVAATV